MEESYTNLPASHFVGSVPSAVSEEKKPFNPEVPGANLQIFPPTNAGSGGQGHGYQTLGDTSGHILPNLQIEVHNNLQAIGMELLSSLYPASGDFASKIDANPDLYGLVWISTTLVFVIASLGNCATYLMNKRSDGSTPWTFDVSYVNVAASSIYGYALIVPLGYYFLLQYLGSRVSLVHFWCLWGYSLFIFILTSLPLVIPFEFVRWTLILIAGAASASFIGLNLRSYIQTSDLTIVAVSAFILQMGLSIFIKMWFFA